MANEMDESAQRAAEHFSKALDIVAGISQRDEILEHIEPEQQKIKTRTVLMLLEVGSHTLVLGLVLGSIFLIHLILKGLLGHEAKFFDLIPIRWIIDVADLLVIGKFLWEIIKDFRRS
jgi:hypothetical protein